MPKPKALPSNAKPCPTPGCKGRLRPGRPLCYVCTVRAGDHCDPVAAAAYVRTFDAQRQRTPCESCGGNVQYAPRPGCKREGIHWGRYVRVDPSKVDTPLVWRPIDGTATDGGANANP